MTPVRQHPILVLLGLVEEVIRKNPIIFEFEVQSSADLHGYPTAWVTLVIPEGVSPIGADGRLTDSSLRPGGLLSVLGELEQAIEESGYVPNVHFRTKPEQERFDPAIAERSA